LKVPVELKRWGGNHLRLPLVGPAYGIPRYSVTPLIFGAACPTTTPLVVDMPEAGNLISSCEQSECVEIASTKAPVTMIAFMMVIRQSEILKNEDPGSRIVVDVRSPSL
jgi:hypothetical protein